MDAKQELFSKIISKNQSDCDASTACSTMHT